MKLAAHIIEDTYCDGVWTLRLFDWNTGDHVASRAAAAWYVTAPKHEWPNPAQAEDWCRANLVAVGMIVYCRNKQKFLARHKAGKRTWHD